MEVTGDDSVMDAMRSERDVILEHWRALGEPTVDARVLSEIRQRLLERFGKAARASPAATARTIADAGGELRHPDVIEVDAQWRQSEFEKMATPVAGLAPLTSGEPLTVFEAEKVIGRLEELRLQYERNGDKERLAQVRSMAVDARRRSQLLAQHSSDDSVRAEQAEVTEWLKVWLQTPKLFADWLELRKRSEDFRSRFAT